MKSLLQDKVTKSIPETWEQSYQQNNFETLDQIKLEYYENLASKNEIKKYSKIPEQYRTENILHLLLNGEKKIFYLNQLMKIFPKEVKSERNIKLFLEKKGYLYYIEKDLLSQEMFKFGLNNNPKNILFVKEDSTFKEIKRLLRVINMTHRLFVIFIIPILIIIPGILLDIFLYYLQHSYTYNINNKNIYNFLFFLYNLVFIPLSPLCSLMLIYDNYEKYGKKKEEV